MPHPLASAALSGRCPYISTRRCRNHSTTRTASGRCRNHFLIPQPLAIEHAIEACHQDRLSSMPFRHAIGYAIVTCHQSTSSSMQLKTYHRACHRDVPSLTRLRACVRCARVRVLARLETCSLCMCVLTHACLTLRAGAEIHMCVNEHGHISSADVRIYAHVHTHTYKSRSGANLSTIPCKYLFLCLHMTAHINTHLKYFQTLILKNCFQNMPIVRSMHISVRKHR